MPYAIDEDAMMGTNGKQKVASLDPAHPPVIQIPHMDFPRAVYMHPNEPFKVVIHRNNHHEIVQEERIPSEHICRIVADARELSQALKEGWVKEPYIAPPLPDPNAHLYDRK